MVVFILLMILTSSAVMEMAVMVVEISKKDGRDEDAGLFNDEADGADVHDDDDDDGDDDGDDNGDDDDDEDEDDVDDYDDDEYDDEDVRKEDEEDEEDEEEEEDSDNDGCRRGDVMTVMTVDDDGDIVDDRGYHADGSQGVFEIACSATYDECVDGDDDDAGEMMMMPCRCSCLVNSVVAWRSLHTAENRSTDEVVKT